MDKLTVITPKPEEKQAGHLTETHRQHAVYALQTDGVVVFENIVDTAHLDMLEERMSQDVQAILARPDAPFNFNTGNLQQDPPPFAPFLFRDILVNDLVIDVTETVLGRGVKNTFYSGNTALPGGTRQPVHPDVGQLWANLAHPTPAFGLVVNIPVVSMGPDNGATELWPGTHLDTTYSLHDGSLRIPEDILQARREIRPPLQPTVPRGSVVIRDIRLWHAGMPNHTQTPRPMIALIHWAGWWSSSDKVRLAKDSGVEEIIEHPRLRTVVEWVNANELDHTKHNTAYDLQK
jgi:ectoine hydroxylase-related dioxygenase (phytanoyl-CoA dioxygenase family)